MGYEYERIDLPWLSSRPPAQAARSKVFKASSSDAPKADTVFPVVVDRIIRAVVPKTKKGKANELLVLENMEVDTTKLLKVNVFVNDEDDNLDDLSKASYAGNYAQVPHKSKNKIMLRTMI